MDNMIEGFKDYTIGLDKSENTIKSYVLNIRQYLSWFSDTYGVDFKELYKENVLEYKAYLVNVKRHNGKSLSAKTVNAKLSALRLFNSFLVESGVQDNMVIENKDLIKVQTSYASPTDITKEDVDNFRQRILEAGDRRLYALVTLLAYSGMRITEALNTKLADLSLEAGELIIRSGKGNKQRVIYLNNKITSSIREYLKVRNDNGAYLFTSRQSDRVDRSVINKHFKKYSKDITPHKLRHFFCTHALESGYAIHEVANIAGHSSVQTTLIYTNPSRDAMKSKAELL